MEEEAHNKRNEVAILSDHVLVLILSHLTARSFCSCKCVCCSWNSLISVSGYRKELLKILVGFFYCSWKCKCNFTSVNGEYPSLSFLPFSIQDVMISDYSQGLILFWYSGFYYVVCNPVTKNGCYCRVATILVVQLAWGLIRQSPRTYMCLNIGSMMMTS
jgi:hypothetical protein